MIDAKLRSIRYGERRTGSTRVAAMRWSSWWSLLFIVGVVFASRTAAAQQPGALARTGIGVGAEMTTTGIVGGTFVYDAGFFHLDALLGAQFASGRSQEMVAGRFFFPLHRSQMADFSIGPGIGIVHTTVSPAGAPSNSANEVHAEGAVQIRAFVVPNVALSASAGLGFVATNGSNSAVIGGQVGGSFGVTYFFF
jgi:hypothetical protein